MAAKYGTVSVYIVCHVGYWVGYDPKTLGKSAIHEYL